MVSDKITYGQLDAVLLELGFAFQRVAPKWLRYYHADSDTEIILVEKNKDDPVRVADTVSARRHLVEKGLVDEQELEALLTGALSTGTAAKQPG